MFKRFDKNKTSSGLSHWWYQKITAVILMPLTIWFLISLPNFINLSYLEKVSWINKAPNYYLMAVFFIISSYHFKLGLTVVIEDYIHNNRIKKSLITIVSIISLLIILSSIILCIIKLLGN
ncbi:MAG: succinate dehydrogenase, hydrophobic membrane anchor protein [Rickettsiales bacterium]|nr:succinate dehydrogenase, hydrophobic membrane anchor protein [Rickettsiales bacterium]OUV80851.1 MAG: succinate dehydrogenase, hydrophobic membrane anchor protein [Rickettsiales bacterium TMED131]